MMLCLPGDWPLQEEIQTGPEEHINPAAGLGGAAGAMPEPYKPPCSRPRVHVSDQRVWNEERRDVAVLEELDHLCSK